MTTGTWSGSPPTCEGGSIFTYMTSVMKFNMHGKAMFCYCKGSLAV